jgi:hypothetical protein
MEILFMKHKVVLVPFPFDDLSSTRDKQGRTLLDKTLIVCMGEFGRTPGDINANKGRDHYRYASTTVFAGGSVKCGRGLGATDDVGYQAVQDRHYYSDLHATILNQLGLDHERLTYRYGGRDYRLTDVHGKVVKEILV